MAKGLEVTGLLHLLIAAVLSLAALGAVAAPRHAATSKGSGTPCVVRGTPAQLDVHCPSATLSQLLAAIRQATGLKGDYPDQVASARVSVVLPRSTLTQVLETALAEFNFAVWRDEHSPYATHVSILGMRRATDRQEPAGDDPLGTRSEIVAGETPAPPVARAPRTVKPGEQAQTSGGVIPAAASRPNDQVQSRYRLDPALRSSADPLEAVRPSAFLLSPPATGRTPLMPQRADGAILRPVPGNGQQ
jgi:hypothetical protein